MKPYLPNNLQYRIISAKGLEAYKHSQAVTLNQLDDAGVHHFSRTAKEILLLKYDMWFDWLLQVEHDLRERQEFDLSARKTFTLSGDIVERRYISIMLTHPENFDQTYAKSWAHVHAGVYDFLKESIHQYDAISITDLFTHISHVLITVMSATLFELHELDNIFYSDEKPFLSVSPICFDYHKMFPDRCLLAERIMEYSTIRPIGKRVTIKNYTDVDNIGPVIDNMRRHGFEVDVVV